MGRHATEVGRETSRNYSNEHTNNCSFNARTRGQVVKNEGPRGVCDEQGQEWRVAERLIESELHVLVEKRKSVPRTILEYCLPCWAT